MSRKECKSVTVLMSLLRTLQGFKDKDKVYNELVRVLIDAGVCTKVDVQEKERRFELLVKEIREAIKQGQPYDEAYTRIIDKYSDFKASLN